MCAFEASKLLRLIGFEWFGVLSAIKLAKPCDLCKRGFGTATDLSVIPPFSMHARTWLHLNLHWTHLHLIQTSLLSRSGDCKALQRVVCLAERISGSALPSMQDVYLKRCKSRAAKIIKDSNHPGNRLFILLPSGKRFRSMMAKTERLRRSFFSRPSGS